jgi:hypothetical protein
MLKMIRKIISGGQTGVDRAGLDFAIEAGLEHGGYVSHGSEGRGRENRKRQTKTGLTAPANFDG